MPSALSPVWIPRCSLRGRRPPDGYASMQGRLSRRSVCEADRWTTYNLMRSAAELSFEDGAVLVRRKRTRGVSADVTQMTLHRPIGRTDGTALRRLPHFIGLPCGSLPLLILIALSLSIRNALSSLGRPQLSCLHSTQATAHPHCAHISSGVFHRTVTTVGSLGPLVLRL